MDIFAHGDYKALVKAWISEQPSGGRGQLTRIAEFLSIGTVLVSQIFSGERELQPDQALALSELFQFTQLERAYFIQLVQIARATTHEYRQYLQRECEEIRKKSRDLRHLIPNDHVLSEEAKGIFHSRWIYSAIRLACSIPGFKTVDSLALKLGLTRQEVSGAVDFLVQNGLCRLEDNQIEMGPAWTHLEASSPYISPRQISWRLKGIEAMDKKIATDLFFTSPLVISTEVRLSIHRELMMLIQRVKAAAEPAACEELHCLNIDFFSV